MSAGLSRTDPEQKTVVGQHEKSSNTGLLLMKETFFLPRTCTGVSLARRVGEGIAEERYPFLLFLHILPTVHKPVGIIGCPNMADHIPAPSKRPERRE